MPLREFSSVKVGDQLPEKIYPLTRQDLVNYAGVSGDLNPIHWDDEIAKVVGLDTAIAHGMLTMGLGGGYVTVVGRRPRGGHRVQRAVHRGGAGAQRRQGRRNRVQRPGEVRRSRTQVGDHRAHGHHRRQEDLRPGHRVGEAGVAHGAQNRHPGHGLAVPGQLRRGSRTGPPVRARRSRPTIRPVSTKKAAAELGYDSLVAPLTFVSISRSWSRRTSSGNVDIGMETMQIVQVDQKFVYHKPIACRRQARRPGWRSIR